MRRGALRSFRRLGLRLVAVRIRTDSCWHIARLRGSSVGTLSSVGAEPSSLVMCALAGLFGVLVLGAPAHGQSAQANWWESLTGSGTPDYTGRRQEDRARDRAAQQNEPLDDLRPDAMPMRSDEMIAAMDAAIAKYQQIADNGGWPVIPPGRMMREGEDDERVPLLRRRLRMSGDLAPRQDAYNSYTFDSELTDAVRRYQRRNGLRPTGRVERSTYPALNMTVDERIAQLRMNLGRIRELMATPVEERYVLVNVPAFQLEAVEKYEVQQRHRVIVGRTERQTPSVKATIRALNFFPYWRVPDSVAHLDLIPRLMKEPEYLQNEKIRVLDPAGNREVDPQTVDWNSPEAKKLKFRQDPGPQNALGLVRIDMPNEHTRLHARHADEAAVQAALARLQRRLRARRGRVRSRRLARAATSRAGTSRAAPNRSSRRVRPSTST